MRRTAGSIIFLTALGACAHAAPPPAAPAAPVRSAHTVSGQPIPAPPPGFELVTSIRDLPAGSVIPTHKHRWPRYVYVERGRIRLVVHDTGLTRDFSAGDVIVEAIEQWHEGIVIGGEPVRLVAFDQVPPGETNMVPKDPN